MDEFELENYLGTLTQGFAFDNEEEQATQEYTQTTVENAVKKYSKNSALYGSGNTQEEQQTQRIRDAVSKQSKIRVDSDAVAKHFSSKHPESYHLLNPITCVYAYIRMTDPDWSAKRKTWDQFREQLDPAILTKSRIIDVIRYIRKYW
jgi:hypothetical protein